MEEAAVAHVGEPVAFEAFFEDEYPGLARALALLTGSFAEGEELAQEAMARAFERWDRVGGMESPAGYIYRTAFNLNHSRLRRLAVRARKALALVPVERDEIAAADARSEVVALLATLPEGQREALVLIEWMGMSSEEAGTMLGVAAVTIRSRLHRAREALRGRFGGESDG